MTLRFASLLALMMMAAILDQGVADVYSPSGTGYPFPRPQPPSQTSADTVSQSVNLRNLIGGASKSPAGSVKRIDSVDRWNYYYYAQVNPHIRNTRESPTSRQQPPETAQQQPIDFDLSLKVPSPPLYWVPGVKAVASSSASHSPSSSR